MDFYFLSDSFYEDYKDCREILLKDNRPYTQVVLEVSNILFAIPLRTHIPHINAYFTDKIKKCGLDFSKAVIIQKDEYINRENKAKVNKEEYKFLLGKDFEVKMGMLRYINEYKKAKANLNIPRNKTLCEYSTLQYYEKYINLI